MCVCTHAHTSMRVVVCSCMCVRVCVCVAGVCGDSCSLNSIIVSNWGLPSQCVAVVREDVDNGVVKLFPLN